MATYKVIQDIEAEDKLVGPLGFRQFVYFLIAILMGYLSFISVAKGLPFLLVITVPPMLFCLFFAWPWSPDQPTEVWALAHIRFYVKARKRVWDQSGIKEFVTVTVPKKIERNYTDGLSQIEVKSRLQALAYTIDSRGWAVKNAYIGSAVTVPGMQDNTDRLLNFSALPQEVSNTDMRAADDILDPVNNPAAYHMNELIDASSKAYHDTLVERMQTNNVTAPAQTNPKQQWFKPIKPGAATAIAQQATVMLPEPILPAPAPSAQTHLKKVQPITAPTPAQSAARQPVKASLQLKAPAPTATKPDAAILNLAHDNNLDVATLAREAKKARDLDASDGEVVISLH